MEPLGCAARSGVIYNIFRVGATRWSQRLDTVAVYYPTPIERNNPYRSRHSLRGEMCTEQRLLAPLVVCGHIRTRNLEKLGNESLAMGPNDTPKMTKYGWLHNQPVCPQLTYATYLRKLEVSQLREIMQVS